MGCINNNYYGLQYSSELKLAFGCMHGLNGTGFLLCFYSSGFPPNVSICIVRLHC